MIGPSTESSFYRNELFTARVESALCDALSRRQPFEDKESGVSIISQIYPVIVLNQLLESSYCHSLKKNLSSNVQYHHKYNDLYDFYQSKDLNSYPFIQQLRDLLLGPVRSLIQGIINRPLSSSHLDLSSQRYSNGHYLLSHDDRLDTRRVAFVLYLVDEHWNENDGGSLDFFPTDWRNEPIHKSPQRFYPIDNTLVFFEVTSISHHQVSQVTSSHDRISISGWFHDDLSPQPEFKKSKILEAPLSDLIQPSDLSLNEQFHSELCQALESIQSEAKLIRTVDDVFLFKQEIFEPIWMRKLFHHRFLCHLWKYSNSVHPYTWYTRPVLKIYSSAHGCYRHPPKMIHDSDQRTFFLVVSGALESISSGRILVIDDPKAITIPMGSDCAIIEINFFS